MGFKKTRNGLERKVQPDIVNSGRQSGNKQTLPNANSEKR